MLTPQNIYDDPDFFRRYGELPRSAGGLARTPEWPDLRDLLPSLKGVRFLDVGCGYGRVCRYAAGEGAAEVVGVDLSEKMLAKARAENADGGVRYVRSAIEDLSFPDAAFDVVFSALAFHYVADIAPVFARLHRLLAPGGTLVFSVEHPMLTTLAAQDWYADAAGARLHWPIDDYADEGPRTTDWLGAAVIKHHRTVATYVNALIDAGFGLRRLIEWVPSAELVTAYPQFADELRRPCRLIVAATA